MGIKAHWRVGEPSAGRGCKSLVAPKLSASFWLKPLKVKRVPEKLFGWKKACCAAAAVCGKKEREKKRWNACHLDSEIYTVSKNRTIKLLQCLCSCVCAIVPFVTFLYTICSVCLSFYFVTLGKKLWSAGTFWTSFLDMNANWLLWQNERTVSKSSRCSAAAAAVWQKVTRGGMLTSIQPLCPKSPMAVEVISSWWFVHHIYDTLNHPLNWKQNTFESASWVFRLILENSLTYLRKQKSSTFNDEQIEFANREREKN